MNPPRSTVRLQLHADFTFDDAREQIPYYASLGITHYYLSPISTARPGSLHGYDVVDPSRINPELGGEPAFRQLAEALKGSGMGILLDIVPNHMATHRANPWWWDVLTHGRDSRHAGWFDIDWESAEPGLRDKVLAPFLGADYGASLNDGKIRLVFDPGTRAFEIDAWGARYPVAPRSLQTGAVEHDRVLNVHDPGTAEGRARLHALIERQHYRLAWWRCAPDSINWRRFFEVSELIGVRVERPEVFDVVHELPLQLYAEGLIDGLRIDHVDGLAYPLTYCRQLREAMESRRGARPDAANGRPPWLLVEKILAEGERLDSRWAVDGTSGYDFMDEVSAVLHDPTGEAPLQKLWARIAPDQASLRDVVDASRRLMLDRHFAAERKTLLRALMDVAQADLRSRDWTAEAVDRVLRPFLMTFPVYRSYIEGRLAEGNDASLLAGVWEQVRARLLQKRDGQALECLPFVAAWLGMPDMAERETMDKASMSAPVPEPLQRLAIRRCQQLTPPLAAKTLEDTAFYRYGRLLSRNEVGADPAMLALSVAAFHDGCVRRAQHAPRALLATATHDHKRGEDARARLAILAASPALWQEAASAWLASPAAGRGQLAAADRYLLLQTLVGAWPLDLDPSDRDGMDAFAERLVAWQQKALREAKLRSSWYEPDSAYEAQAAAYTRSLLSSPPTAQSLHRFVCRVAPAGAVNGLVQAVLRLTCPGVPDLYQGTELWDFSLVDPDNRRPVDYDLRRHLQATSQASPWASRLAQWRDGAIKQAIIHAILAARRNHGEVFGPGGYRALATEGGRANACIAFLREGADRAAMVVVPRLCFDGIGDLPRVDPDFWAGTAVTLPMERAGSGWRSLFTGNRVRVSSDGQVDVAACLSELPVGVFVPDQG